MRTISILTAFDTEKILTTGTSQNIGNPVKVGPDSLYMVVNDHNLIDHQASGDLIVQAKVGDVLEWRASSLSGNMFDCVHFYGFEAETAGVFEPPQPGKSTKGLGADAISAFWNAAVIGDGNSRYTLYFSIRYRDESGLSTLSYYYWKSEDEEEAAA